MTYGFWGLCHFRMEKFGNPCSTSDLGQRKDSLSIKLRWENLSCDHTGSHHYRYPPFCGYGRRIIADIAVVPGRRLARSNLIGGGYLHGGELSRGWGRQSHSSLVTPKAVAASPAAPMKPAERTSAPLRRRLNSHRLGVATIIIFDQYS